MAAGVMLVFRLPVLTALQVDPLVKSQQSYGRPFIPSLSLFLGPNKQQTKQNSIQ
jgi:hypothetical protein